MRIRSIKGWPVLIAVILTGIAITGAGFWLWDSRDYPLPSSVEKSIAGGAAPVTGIRYDIALRRNQLRTWRKERLWREHLRNVDLSQRNWRYQVSHPRRAGTVRGTLAFQTGGKAIFSPPISGFENSIPGTVNYSRPRFDIVRLSWEKDKRLDLDLESANQRTDTFRMLGKWEGRPMFFWH